MKTKILVVVAVVGFLAVLGLFLPRQLPVTKEVIREVRETLGAFPGPDIDSKFLTINGVGFQYERQRALTGTTTPCTFQSPDATSTLIGVGISWSPNGATTTSGNILTFATSTLRNATTSAFARVAIPANSQTNLYVKPTTTPATQVLFGTVYGTMGPNVFVNVGSSGGEAPGNPSGYCTAVFQEL